MQDLDIFHRLKKKQKNADIAAKRKSNCRHERRGRTPRVMPTSERAEQDDPFPLYYPLRLHLRVIHSENLGVLLWADVRQC